jgi:hypothetical protein
MEHKHVVVRSETVEDQKEISRVISNAFDKDDESLLVENLRKSPQFIPELSLVAVNNSTIVGHILFFPIKIHTGSRVILLYSSGVRHQLHCYISFSSTECSVSMAKKRGRFNTYKAWHRRSQTKR